MLKASICSWRANAAWCLVLTLIAVTLMGCCCIGGSLTYEERRAKRKNEAAKEKAKQAKRENEAAKEKAKRLEELLHTAHADNADSRYAAWRLAWVFLDDPRAQQVVVDQLTSVLESGVTPGSVVPAKKYNTYGESERELFERALDMALRNSSTHKQIRGPLFAAIRRRPESSLAWSCLEAMYSHSSPWDRKVYNDPEFVRFLIEVAPIDRPRANRYRDWDRPNVFMNYAESTMKGLKNNRDYQLQKTVEELWLPPLIRFYQEHKNDECMPRKDTGQYGVGGIDHWADYCGIIANITNTDYVTGHKKCYINFRSGPGYMQAGRVLARLLRTDAPPDVKAQAIQRIVEHFHAEVVPIKKGWVLQPVGVSSGYEPGNQPEAFILKDSYSAAYDASKLFLLGDGKLPRTDRMLVAVVAGPLGDDILVEGTIKDGQHQTQIRARLENAYVLHIMTDARYLTNK